MERLSEIYWDLQSEADPIALEDFLDRAAAGEYGPVTADELRAFLREVEARLIHRIEYEESSALEAAAHDELIDETRSWIEDLVGRYCGE